VRLIVLALTIMFSTAADACPSGQVMTFARDEDGAVFKPDRYGAREDRLPAWFVYRGTFKGRMLYMASGNMPGSTGLGTSGARPPAAGIKWEKALEPHEAEAPVRAFASMVARRRHTEQRTHNGTS
jgi:hypothetical protein